MNVGSHHPVSAKIVSSAAATTQVQEERPYLFMKTAATSGTKLQNKELKDAYRTWLKDLHDDKPYNLLKKLGKKKGGNGRKARRSLQMQHAQQHTAASALKDVALIKSEKAKLPALYVPVDKQVLHDAQRRRQQVLVDEANYSGIQYSCQPSWRPGLSFFQQLVHCVLLKGAKVMDESNGSLAGIVSSELVGFPVRIAPMLLRVPFRSDPLENRFGVALIYCQEQNQEEKQLDSSSFALVCRVYSQETSWRAYRNVLLEIISNSSAEICAVRKRVCDLDGRCNDLELLRSHQEVEQAIDELWINKDDIDHTKNNCTSELLAVQTYIPFKGATNKASTFTSPSSMEPSAERKAWIARCAFRKRDKLSSVVWIISGGGVNDGEKSSSTFVTSSGSATCQLIKCTVDEAWSEPRLLASMCMITLERTLQVRFNELVVDLLQDSYGKWWLLQVKAFSLASIRPISAVSMASLSSSSLLSKKNLKGLSRTQSAPNQFEAGFLPTPQWKKWRCAGRYCISKTAKKIAFESANQDSIGEDDDDANEPPGYLTKKVLRSCEFFDDFVRQQDMSLAGGFMEFPSALAFHLQHRLPKRDRSQLYERQPLCSVCLRQYHSLRQQWTQTVGDRNAPTASNTIAGTRKISRLKSFKEHADAPSIHPRKLPSLHSDFVTSSSLYSSCSTPVLPASNTKTQSLTKPEDGTIVLNKPAYLDELVAMDEMLAEHDPPSFLNSSSTFQTRKHETTSVTSFPPEDYFPKWDGETRIEAMWQNLALKPLKRQFSSPTIDTNIKIIRTKGYNSISLHQEMAKAAENTESNLHNDQLVSSEMTVVENQQQSEIMQSPRMKHVPLHSIPVHHCRRVFEDEVYREELVSDAISALESRNSNACFVVAPRHRISTNSPSAKQPPTEEEDELAEMALRSLYIDVKQAIVAKSDEMVTKAQLSSWPTRPKVYHEASGCMTVKLGPP